MQHKYGYASTVDCSGSEKDDSEEHLLFIEQKEQSSLKFIL